MVAAGIKQNNMGTKKYRLTENHINIGNRILYQIEALKDFGNVKSGDLGGYIESEENLSQYDNAWVYGNARVYGDAQVRDNAQVYGDAQVRGNAQVFGNAQVHGNARVYGDAQVHGNARVYDDAQVHGSAKVFDNAEVYGDAKVYGDAQVHGSAKVFDNAEVHGDAKVYGDAEIKSTKDYIVFKNWWSSGRYFTWTRSNNMWKVGCFYGTGEELIKKAYNDSKESGREYERVVRYVESILADEKRKENEPIGIK